MEGENASPDSGQLAGGAGDAQVSWFDDIHADYRGEKSLEKFSRDADGLNNIVKSYLSLEKKMGNAINLPGENATEQDVLDFRKKLGIPDTADKYEVKYREHDAIKITEDADKEWKSFAHKIGLTPKQVQELTDFEFGRLERAYDAHANRFKEAEDALRQEFGNGYQDVLDRANNVLRTFADAGSFAAITNPDGAYANDPTLIKLLANIGSQMGEHAFKSGEQKTPQDTKEEIQKKMLDLQLVYMDESKDKIARKAANAEYQRLAEQIYGNAEVSTSIGLKF